jgi:O-succinylbenzoate synthase
MSFEIYRFSCTYPFFKKEGLLLHSNKNWSEVSPYPGKNQETLEEALAQLKMVQQGWKGALLPSVAFGLYSLKPPIAGSYPVCLLLMGKENPGYTTAKVKLGDYDVATARQIASDLKNRYSLRIDLQEKWTPEQVREFCSYFQPEDFEFIEDPGCDIAPFPMKTEATTVWKPMVRGIPPSKAEIILSSTFESGVGISQIASLSSRQKIPVHPLGIGTYNYLEDDLLKEPLIIRDGYIQIPPELRVKRERLTLC